MVPHTLAIDLHKILRIRGQIYPTPSSSCGFASTREERDENEECACEPQLQLDTLSKQ